MGHPAHACISSRPENPVYIIGFEFSPRPWGFDGAGELHRSFGGQRARLRMTGQIRNAGLERLMKLVAIFVLVLSLAFLSFVTPAVAQQSGDKDSDKKEDVPASQAPVTQAGKKDQKKDSKKDEAKDACKGGGEECPAHAGEKKPGMNADTFSGLKFRSIGPAVASGRVMAIAVNPKNKFEYYVGVASGGVWKTVNDGTTWTPVFDK